MSGTHGDLFVEIGKTVLAAHAGQAIDLTQKSEELAHRYWNLGVPPETIAKAIARSLGAIGMSMAIVSRPDGHASGNGNGHAAVVPADDVIRVNGGDGNDSDHATAPEAPEPPAKSAPALFPSGVRLAVLS